MQESFYTQGFKVNLQTAALPMESSSSGDIYGKLCFLICAPTPTSSIRISSFCSTSSLISQSGCPRVGGLALG